MATGKPALEILQIAERRRADLIVMSTHGLTGPRKWLLGSTTERVLRDTTTAVLVTPARADFPMDLEAMRAALRARTGRPECRDRTSGARRERAGEGA